MKMKTSKKVKTTPFLHEERGLQTSGVNQPTGSKDSQFDAKNQDMPSDFAADQERGRAMQGTTSEDKKVLKKKTKSKGKLT